tara:strand:- start:312 stop:575 length:264 start_codon:yes stop_codon:yes gene_type:complete
MKPITQDIYSVIVRDFRGLEDGPTKHHYVMTEDDMDDYSSYVDYRGSKFDMDKYLIATKISPTQMKKFEMILDIKYCVGYGEDDDDE